MGRLMEPAGDVGENVFALEAASARAATPVERGGYGDEADARADAVGVKDRSMAV